MKKAFSGAIALCLAAFALIHACKNRADSSLKAGGNAYSSYTVAGEIRIPLKVEFLKSAFLVDLQSRQQSSSFSDDDKKRFRMSSESIDVFQKEFDAVHASYLPLRIPTGLDLVKLRQWVNKQFQFAKKRLEKKGQALTVIGFEADPSIEC